MRVNTKVLFENVEERVEIYKKTEAILAELEIIEKQLKNEEPDSSAFMELHKIHEKLEKDFIKLRQIGSAFSTIVKIYMDTDNFITDHSDGEGFMYECREEALMNYLGPLESSYLKVVRGENLDD